jgi:hypothetical protein
VQVRHEGCERIAYLDSERKWRKETNGEVLRGEVTVCETDLNSLRSLGRLL